MILSAHVTEAPEPVTKYRETVSPALAQLVMRCLEKKPADRWQSAEELLQQLEALATPSAGVTPTDMLPVTAAVPRRRKLAVGLVAAALVIAATAVAVFRPERGAVLDPNRVVVAVLENETGDPSLDLIGKQAGHWITQGHDHVLWHKAVAAKYRYYDISRLRRREPRRACKRSRGQMH